MDMIVAGLVVAGLLDAEALNVIASATILFSAICSMGIAWWTETLKEKTI